MILQMMSLQTLFVAVPVLLKRNRVWVPMTQQHTPHKLNTNHIHHTAFSSHLLSSCLHVFLPVYVGTHGVLLTLADFETASQPVYDGTRADGSWFFPGVLLTLVDFETTSRPVYVGTRADGSWLFRGVLLTLVDLRPLLGLSTLGPVFTRCSANRGSSS